MSRAFSWINYVVSLAFLIAYVTTDYIGFGLAAIIYTVYSTECAIISAIEKTKEGR